MAPNICDGLSGLRIYTPETVRIEERDGCFEGVTRRETEPTVSRAEDDTLTIGRFGSSDSLNRLVVVSPGLSHVGELFALPTPVTASVAAMSPQLSRTRFSMFDPNASPLRPMNNQSSPRMLTIDSLHETSQTQARVLPPKALARLQGEERSARHVSLNVSQPVSLIEMPQLTRHRSQSKVPRYGETETLHREPHLTENSVDEFNRELPKHLMSSNEQAAESFIVTCAGVQKTFRGLRTLGEGTFSRVILALQENRPAYDKCPALVAIKVVQLLSSGSDEQARVAMAVRREIDLLSKVHLPLLIKMHAHSVGKESAHLILDYHSGGDLFTLASEHKFMLTSRLVKRIFAEILIAVRHLHKHNIVHRDLKLENILLRLPANRLASPEPFDQLLSCLTDLGLAREFDPDSPELSTRCGSEDYAAPEIIMGQPYDGRQTDAWALGALLYCLLEGRLPFDVIPGLEHKMKSKVLHRICRIEWRWVILKEAGRYDSEWDGAKRVVGNLLRSRTKRWTLDHIAEDDWLVDEIEVVEGLISRHTQPQE